MMLASFFRTLLVGVVAYASSSVVMAQDSLSMTLTDCITYAKAHNLSVQRLRIALAQRQEQLQSAKDNRLPTASASASGTLNFGRGLNAQNTYVSQNTQSIGLNANASMPLFTGHRLSSAIAQARIDLSAAMADLEKANDDLSLNIAQAYLQVLFQHERIAVAQQQLAMSHTLKTRLEGLLRDGRIAEYEVVQAQAQIASDEVSVVEAQNDYTLALLELSQLLELPKPEGFSIVAPTDSLPSFTFERPDAIFATASQQRPMIEAERLRVASAQEQIRQARSGFFPTISLTAGLGSSYFRIAGAENTPFGRQMRNNFGQNIGISISYNLFDAFSTRHAVRQAQLAHEEQSLQLSQTLKTLYTEIQRAYYNATAAQGKYTASKAAEASALEALRMATQKYEYGRGHQVEYTEARTKWLVAQSQVLQAKYEYLFRHKILSFYAGKPIE